MIAGDDRDLRERFAALRDEDAASVPSLATVLHGRTGRPRTSRVPWIPVAALASAAALTTVVLLAPGGRHETSLDEAIEQAQSIASWTAPTDAWLTLSGFEIPSSVPSLSLSSVTLPEASTEETSQGESR
jgi:hypothetical protein